MPPQLSRYAVLGEIATGSLGDVWLARAKTGGGLCVVRTFSPALEANAGYLQALEKAAQPLTALSHPRCVRVLEVGVEAGVHFVAFEWVEGLALLRVLRRAEGRGPQLPVQGLVRIVLDALEGLAAAEAQRDGAGQPLAHAELTAASILVGLDGTSKLKDAGFPPPPRPGLHPGATGSKRGFTAPEVVRGGPPDARSDVFSMGRLLYRGLTGEEPFGGPTDEEVNRALLELTPPLPSRLSPTVMPELDEVVMRALEKDPAQRYPGAAELRAALEKAVEGIYDAKQLEQYLLQLWPAEDPDRAALRELIAGRRPAEAGPALQANLDEVEVTPWGQTRIEEDDDLADESLMAQEEKPPSKWARAALPMVGFALVMGATAMVVFTNDPPPRPAPPRSAVTARAHDAGQLPDGGR